MQFFLFNSRTLFPWMILPTQIACTVYPVQRVSQDEESGQVTVELQSSLRSAVDTFTLNTPYQV